MTQPSTPTTPTLLTGYQVSQVASQKLGRAVKPQMVYNYIKKGYLPSVSVKNAKGEMVKMVTIQATADFIKKLQNPTTNRKDALKAAMKELEGLL